MAVRVSRYRELCSVCKNPTERACFRCKSPLCADHQPAATRRCERCESDYRRWPSREPRVIAVGAALALAWIAGTVGLLEVSTLAAVVWSLTLPAIVSVFALRLDSGRSIFLRQQTRPQSVADERDLRL